MLEPLPSDLPDAFRIADALARGASRRRLNGPDLAAPFHGARVQASHGADASPDASADDWDRRRRAHLRRLRAYLPVLQPGGFFCGPSAAVVWDIPMPPWTWPDDVVHVGIHRPRRAPRRPDVVGHQFTRGFIHLDEVSGLPVTDAGSTWASLATHLGVDDLVSAADRILRIPRHPGGFRPVTTTALATREDLEELARRKGRPGAPALRTALRLARTGSSSPPETRIRLILVGAGLPEPALDFDVYDAQGRFLGCSELAYPDLRLAIEYESDGHLTRPQLQRDIDKYQAYAEAGWYALRLTAEHVYRHPPETVRRVRRARAAAASGGAPWPSADPSIWR